MRDPWALFDALLDMPSTRRRDGLESVLAACSVDSTSTESERLELIAAVKAELARCGALALEDAIDAVTEAEAAGRTGWPNYYLAEAACQLGRPALVVSCLATIPPGFFVSRDLNWRACRCLELASIAQVDLGNWRRAEQLVDQLASEYALSGDEGDLAPPRDLVTKLVSSMPRARAALETLDASLDLASWVGHGLAETALAALALDGGNVGDGRAGR